MGVAVAAVEVEVAAVAVALAVALKKAAAVSLMVAAKGAPHPVEGSHCLEAATTCPGTGPLFASLAIWLLAAAAA